ncbi:MAG TPA: HNH endonuclease signature motif containing protein [Acidimicrobiales bacterium]|nr:HNH endonuclease signature motif containing protein [Acidimicrobiales bacterium]
MSDMLVRDAAYFAEVRPGPAARRLVEVGLWHDAVSLAGCGPCLHGDGGVPATPSLAAGEFLYHAWWEQLLDGAGKDDALRRWRERRRKALNADKELVGRIRRRDRDRCRYCGVLTEDSSGANKKGARVRQLDHVDPWCTDGPHGYGNTLGNVVVACRTCNGRKRDLTPQEAGIELLPPPGGEPAESGGAAGSTGPKPAADRAADPAAPRVARETGTGRIGAGSPAGSGQDGPPGPGGVLVASGRVVVTGEANEDGREPGEGN